MHLEVSQPQLCSVYVQLVAHFLEELEGQYHEAWRMAAALA